MKVNVYGVKVPHADGRAGMAALSVDEQEFSFAKLHEAVERELPSYARPLFLRMLPTMEVTATFKLKKHTLRGEGVDMMVVKDPVYVNDTKYGAYAPFTVERFEDCMASSNSGRDALA